MRVRAGPPVSVHSSATTGCSGHVHRASETPRAPRGSCSTHVQSSGTSSDTTPTGLMVRVSYSTMISLCSASMHSGPALNHCTPGPKPRGSAAVLAAGASTPGSLGAGVNGWRGVYARVVVEGRQQQQRAAAQRVVGAAQRAAAAAQHASDSGTSSLDGTVHLAT